MYAIVDIAGQQIKVSKDQYVYAPLMLGDAGTKLDFANVLLVDDGNTVSVGSPLLEGAIIKAKILAHVKGDKVIVFKKKRRKGYQKSNGHRQNFTKILIEDIIL